MGSSAEANAALAPGEHTLTLSFEDTWPRTLGKIISAASLVACITLHFLSKNRTRMTQVKLIFAD